MMHWYSFEYDSGSTPVPPVFNLSEIDMGRLCDMLIILFIYLVYYSEPVLLYKIKYKMKFGMGN